MKKLNKIQIIGLILLVISALLLLTYSSSPENLKVIPKETNVVSVIDIYSIIKKGKLSEISELKLFKTFKKEIRNENKKVSKIIDDLIEDPTLSGINFKTDVFVYYIDESRDEKFISFSAEINDQEKFAEFIENSLDNLEIEFDINKEENYNYTLIDNEAVIGWDEKKAVLLIPANYSSKENLDLEVETLMELTEKDQITAIEEFNKFYSSKKDISLWFSTNFFEDSFDDFKKIEKVIDFDITDNYISAYLNFEDNYISLLTQFTPNSEIQKMLEENDVYNNSFNKNLLNYFPKQSFATASFSVNPTAYYNILKQEDYFENIQKAFKDETGLEFKNLFESIQGNAIYSLFGFENVEYTYMDWRYGFNESEASLLDERYPISDAGYLSSEDKELLNQGKTIRSSEYYGRYCINIKNILQKGGNVETAIANDSKINWYEGGWGYGQFEETKKEYLPLMGLAFDINGNKIIKKLIKKFPEDVINKRSNYYEFKFENRYPAYFAFNENIFFITNDKKSIEAFKNGGYNSDNLGSSNISSDITKNNLYSFINLNYDEYPKELKKEIKNNQDGEVEKLFEIWNSFAKSIEFKQIDKYSVEIIFNTKDNENNTLYTFIKTIDDYYKYLLKPTRGIDISTEEAEEAPWLDTAAAVYNDSVYDEVDY